MYKGFVSVLCFLTLGLGLGLGLVPNSQALLQVKATEDSFTLDDLGNLIDFERLSEECDSIATPILNFVESAQAALELDAGGDAQFEALEDALDTFCNDGDPSQGCLDFIAEDINLDTFVEDKAVQEVVRRLIRRACIKSPITGENCLFRVLEDLNTTVTTFLATGVRTPPEELPSCVDESSGVSGANDCHDTLPPFLFDSGQVLIDFVGGLDLDAQDFNSTVNLTNIDIDLEIEDVLPLCGPTPAPTPNENDEENSAMRVQATGFLAMTMLLLGGAFFSLV